MIFRIWAALIVLTSPALAEGPGDLRARLQSLYAPQASPAYDPYALEKADDLALIAAEADHLFPGTARIALFIGPQCPDCDTAQAELLALAARRQITVTVLDISDLNQAALLSRLSLDTVPSYVMPDRLIRGPMPIFVLDRYLD